MGSVLSFMWNRGTRIRIYAFVNENKSTKGYTKKQQ